MVDKISAQTAIIPDVPDKYITMSPSPFKEEEKKDTVEISQPSAAKESEIPAELQPKKKSKKNTIAVLSLTGAAAITLFGVLFNTRGWNKKLNRILQQAIEKIKNPGAEPLNLTKLKENIAAGAKSEKVVRTANFMNNTANFKDCYILPVLEKIPGLRWFARSTSNVYRKTGVKMTQGAYQHANSAYTAYDSKVKKIIDSLADTTHVKDIEKKLAERNGILKERFAPSSVSNVVNGTETGRIKLMDEMMDEGRGICLDVRDKFTGLVRKLFKSKGKDREGFGHFVAEDLLKEKKVDYIERLKPFREQIEKCDNEIIDLLKKSGIETSAPEQLQGLMKTRNGAFKSLNHAIRTEANDLFDKMRDIKIGCAPTDILGIGTSAGLLGLYMAQADSKEQKVDVALTTGVPLGLGMAATTFTTMKMYTGLKPLLVGAATTFVANTIGKFLAKQYKKSHNVKEQKPEIPTLENTVGELNKKVIKKVKKHAENQKA